MLLNLFLAKESFRKKKELEEARKAGRAPLEVDEYGQEINPHIPQFIAKAPWYIDSGAPGLKHQHNRNLKRSEITKEADTFKKSEFV